MRTKVYLWKANAQFYGLGEGRKIYQKLIILGTLAAYLSSLVTRLLSEQNSCCRKTSYRREYMLFHL